MQSIIEYLKRGPSTSKEIQAAMGLSQSTVSRMLKDLGGSIVQITDGRSVRYAATCNAFGVNDRIPLSIIDESGEIHSIADVRPLNCGQFFIEPKEDFPSLLLGEKKNGLYDDLPYFLLDLKPQGYLGRQIAKRISKQLDDFPADPRSWNTNHIGRYLISNGEDLPGNFILGEQLLLRVRRDPVAADRADYPELVEKAVKGDPPGSSAGGEQQKFTAFNRELYSHVIVKFSGKGKNEVIERWRDILITEYHAATVLAEHGYPVAQTDLFELDGRLFLETQRFDRVGIAGRLPMISLDMVDREFVGIGNNWHRVMEDLHAQGLVSEEDAQTAQELQFFGRLINNTDMHLGNLSLSIKGGVFGLLPAYDMCSMGFAPKNGEVLPYEAAMDLQINASHDRVPDNIREMVCEFWQNVLSDERISGQLNDFLSHNDFRFLDTDSGMRM